MRDVNNLKNLCKDVGLVLKDRNGKVIEKDSDTEGRIVVRNEYTPYGENIKDLPDSKKFTNQFKREDLLGYTGHIQIPEANLIYESKGL